MERGGLAQFKQNPEQGKNIKTKEERKEELRGRLINKNHVDTENKQKIKFRKKQRELQQMCVSI